MQKANSRSKAPHDIATIPFSPTTLSYSPHSILAVGGPKGQAILLSPKSFGFHAFQVESFSMTNNVSFAPISSNTPLNPADPSLTRTRLLICSNSQNVRMFSVDLRSREENEPWSVVEPESEIKYDSCINHGETYPCRYIVFNLFL